jgi:predicted TIM-barrel fold metal-dependent hydrolase
MDNFPDSAMRERRVGSAGPRSAFGEEAIIPEKFPPAGACDCHVHVIGPKSRFPLAETRSYTPPDAPAPALQRMLGDLGLDRVVIVQPSIYGYDNSCLVAALDEFGKRARGVVMLAPDTPASTLDALHARGVRGVRINVASIPYGSLDEFRAEFQRTSGMCALHGWHIQTFVPARMLTELAVLAELPVPLVIDHFGMVEPEHADGPEARALLTLLDTGNVWVKLSAPYRIADAYRDPRIAPLARLMARNPERVMWGSDWPHTPHHTSSGHAGEAETPYRDLDTGDLLAQVRTWFPDAAMQRRVLVENPARLYGWPAATP